jgi:hypothetical protein
MLISNAGVANVDSCGDYFSLTIANSDTPRGRLNFSSGKRSISNALTLRYPYHTATLAPFHRRIACPASLHVNNDESRSDRRKGLP